MRTKLLLLLLTGFCANCQSFEILKAETQKICDAYYNMDFERIATMSYPLIYSTIGKPAFIEKLDSDYQNLAYRKRIEIAAPQLYYSEMTVENARRWCIISYKNPIRYFFEVKMEALEAQQKADSLKRSVGAYEVVVEPKRNSINVKRNSKLIAVSDEHTVGEWRFINLDDDMQKQFLNTLFDAATIKAMGL